MITQEQNNLLTQTGRSTPCGELMRRYWQPAALSEDLTADKPLPVTLFGEELLLFRDDQSRPALIGRYCAHQGFDIVYGRVEPAACAACIMVGCSMLAAKSWCVAIGCREENNECRWDSRPIRASRPAV